MRIVVLLVIFLVPVALWGQKKRSRDRTDTSALHLGDTTLVKPGDEVVPIESQAKRFDPRKAMLYAAILPGAGQVYNKKYWKVPLVYGLVGGGVYYLHYNTGLYNDYKEQLFSLLSEPNPVVYDPNTNLTPSGNLYVNKTLTSPKTRLTTDQLRNAVNRYRRDRDFSVLLLGIVYFAQMLDAHVDAHLMEFDVNPQMKVAIEPSVQPTLYGRSSGLSVRFKF